VSGAAGHRLDAGVGAVGVYRQQKSLRENVFRHTAAVGDRSDPAQAAGAQHRFLRESTTSSRNRDRGIRAVRLPFHVLRRGRVQRNE
jgi:hypothetical protein